jgi:hypothetical protein
LHGGTCLAQCQPPSCARLLLCALCRLQRRGVYGQEYWPNPERFDPDRFLSTPKPFTFIPFNGGPRLCLGMDMSYLEAKAALVHLLRRCVASGSAAPVFTPIPNPLCMPIPNPLSTLSLCWPVLDCLGTLWSCMLCLRYRFKLHPGFEVILKSKVMLTAANGIRMDLSPR